MRALLEGNEPRPRRRSKALRAALPGRRRARRADRAARRCSTTSPRPTASPRPARPQPPRASWAASARGGCTVTSSSLPRRSSWPATRCWRAAACRILRGAALAGRAPASRLRLPRPSPRQRAASYPRAEGATLPLPRGREVPGASCAARADLGGGARREGARLHRGPRHAGEPQRTLVSADGHRGAGLPRRSRRWWSATGRWPASATRTARSCSSAPRSAARAATSSSRTTW